MLINILPCACMQCLKAALFLTYQILTTHFTRFQKWASLKTYMILDIIDTVFWFALFAISVSGGSVKLVWRRGRVRFESRNDREISR